jgi:predicted amidohydrolase YtcJ
MRIFIVRVLMVIFGCVTSLVCVAQADLILINGKIFTAEDPQRYVEALAIKDNRIIAVGTSNEVKKHGSDKTRIVDVQGRVVIPGINDAHNHLPSGLVTRPIAFSSMDPTWDVALDSLVMRAKVTPKGKWIEAPIGITIANAPASTINRLIIDRLVPDHPVRLNSFWGHVCIFNTTGLQAMGIDIRQPDPKGGFYDRFDNGTLTGRTIEKNAYFPHTSYQLVTKMRDKSAYVAGLKAYTKQLLTAGITS